MEHQLSARAADRLASIVLGHVTREYPNKLDHVLTGHQDVLTPRALHPVFYGSFDWHSCVHGHWTLARILRRFPGLSRAPAIRTLFNSRLTPQKIAVEHAYAAAPSARGFERPYGWAWLLKPAEELGHHAEPRWAAALAPLADLFAERFRAFLPKADYPVRAGTHMNTAFSLVLVHDYARAQKDGVLAALLTDKALTWYGRDRGCQAWEPGGNEFLSPALIEAECMRRLLPAGQFAGWLAGFLPVWRMESPATLFRPVSGERPPRMVRSHISTDLI